MKKKLEEEVRRNKEEMSALQESWQQKMAEREKEFMVSETPKQDFCAVINV